MAGETREQARERLKQRFTLVKQNARPFSTDKIPEPPAENNDARRPVSVAETGSDFKVEENPLAASGCDKNVTQSASAVDHLFFRMLAMVEQEFLRMVSGGSISYVRCQQYSKQFGLFPMQFLDQINQKSLESLGYNILQTDGESVWLESSDIV